MLSSPFTGPVSSPGPWPSGRVRRTGDDWRDSAVGSQHCYLTALPGPHPHV